MMRLVAKAVRAGKTHAAILESAKNGATIVCFSDVEATQVERLAVSMGLKIPSPISYTHFPRDTQGMKGPFIVDNADIILESILQQKISMMTVTAVPTSIKEISKC